MENTGTGGGAAAGGGAAGGAAGGGAPAGDTACAAAAGFASTSVRPRGRRLGLRFSRRSGQPVTVDVFQTSHGRTVVGERLVARFARRTRGLTWNGRANRRGRKVTDGYYFARFRTRFGSAGRVDTRRITLKRANGRWRKRPAFYRRASCGAISAYKLERPVFGGRDNRALFAAYQLSRDARVRLEVLRKGRVVRTYAARDRRGRETYRVRFGSERRRRGDYRFRLTVTGGGRTTVATLTSRRL